MQCTKTGLLNRNDNNVFGIYVNNLRFYSFTSVNVCSKSYDNSMLDKLVAFACERFLVNRKFGPSLHKW